MGVEVERQELERLLALERKFAKEGLTFDDVLLQPAESAVLPNDVSTATRLTRTIEVAIPVVCSAMDTVTEARLAIALAREGGIGIVHRNLSIAEQVAEVDKVKRSESGMIVDPVTLPPDVPVARALELMERYHISGVPITYSSECLVGILTNRDLRFHRDAQQPVSALMTSRDLVTAPVGTTLEEASAILGRHKIEKLPVVDADGRLRGLITVKDIQKRIEFPRSTKDDRGRLQVAAAVGVEALIDAGADAVKVGQGPGAACTTRVVAGVGVPQVTAVYDCAQVAQRYRAPVIADGGLTSSGDVAKAIAAGADAVMTGSLLAGTDEAPGEVVFAQGDRFKEYRGMGSRGARKARGFCKGGDFQGNV